MVGCVRAIKWIGEICWIYSNGWSGCVYMGVGGGSYGSGVGEQNDLTPFISLLIVSFSIYIQYRSYLNFNLYKFFVNVNFALINFSCFFFLKKLQHFSFDISTHIYRILHHMGIITSYGYYYTKLFI